MRETQARGNLETLRQNPYPGRGIVVGLDETGRNMIQIYWIMGRSANSRNRIFGTDGRNRLFTEPANPALVEDPSLIIYDAMVGTPGLYVVSNGHQTAHTFERMNHSMMSLWEALNKSRFSFEPDAPNYTPRITATYIRGTKTTEMLLQKKSPHSNYCESHFFSLALEPSFGYCITTYSGDGNPLPSFKGEPYELPLKGSAETILETFWETLNPENRISLAVLSVDEETFKPSFYIKNRFEKIEP